MTSFGVAHFQQKGRGRLAYHIIICGVGTLIFWGGLFTGDLRSYEQI